MAKRANEAGLTEQIEVLVGEPHGDHIHEHWWPLARLAPQLEGSSNAGTPAEQLRVLVNVQHGDHAHEHWWSIGELAAQRAAISAGSSDAVPTVFVNVPHGDHAHESWLPLDQCLFQPGLAPVRRRSGPSNSLLGSCVEPNT
jgi:hypothetical protein